MTLPVEITLADMRFLVCVGILPHERELPQPLEVDLTVRVTAAAGDTLDYRTLYGAVSDSVLAAPIEYLETIANQIAVRIIAMPGVSWCRVAVRKPHVMLPGPLAYAQVAVERAHA